MSNLQVRFLCTKDFDLFSTKMLVPGEKQDG